MRFSKDVVGVCAVSVALVCSAATLIYTGTAHVLPFQGQKRDMVMRDAPSEILKFRRLLKLIHHAVAHLLDESNASFHHRLQTRALPVKSGNGVDTDEAKGRKPGFRGFHFIMLGQDQLKLQIAETVIRLRIG